MAFLFEEIRYEVCGVEVDRTKNVGITSTVKLLLSSNEHERKHLINAGWVTTTDDSLTVHESTGDFTFCLPFQFDCVYIQKITLLTLNMPKRQVSSSWALLSLLIIRDTNVILTGKPYFIKL